MAYNLYNFQLAVMLSIQSKGPCACILVACLFHTCSHSCSSGLDLCAKNDRASSRMHIEVTVYLKLYKLKVFYSVYLF